MGAGLRLWDESGDIIYDSSVSKPARILGIVSLTNDTFITDSNIQDDGAQYFAYEVNNGLDATGKTLSTSSQFNFSLNRLGIALVSRPNFPATPPSVIPINIVYGKIIN